MAELELRNINKVYPNGTAAAKDISFKANSGDFVVLVGPSGCGKTTILKMIAGLEEVSTGEILFDGKQVENLPPKSRDVGMVFQNYALYPHLTVRDNIAFPLSIKKIPKKQIKDRVEEIANMLNISELLGKRPKEISGGERQRVALGRAIIRQPKIFLFDEPLSNLDAKLRVQMRAEIINLQRKLGVTSVYVTHDQTEAMTMGNKIVVLNKGEIQQIDSPENIYNLPDNLFTAGFIGSPQMNLFQGSIVRDSLPVFQECNGGCRFNLLNDSFTNYLIKEEKNITFGIRPENIKPRRDEPENSSFIHASITNIEYLGHEFLFFFQTSSGMKAARTDNNENFNIGEKVYFVFDSSKLIAFDKNELLIKR